MSPPRKCTDAALRAALAAHDGNATRAGRAVGMHAVSVLRRARALGIATKPLGYRPPYVRPTRRQAEVAYHVVMLGSCEAAAGVLGVSPQAVSARLAGFRVRAMRMMAAQRAEEART